MGTAPQVGQFLADMHGHSGNFLRTEMMKDIMPGYVLSDVIELPIQSGHAVIECLVGNHLAKLHWLANNKHLYVVDISVSRVVAMWNYDGHTLGIAIYRVAAKETADMIAKAYRVLKDIRNQWLERNTPAGQGLLVDLNRWVAITTAKTGREVAELGPWPADESTAYKTAAEPLIDHLQQQGYSLAQIDSVIASAPKFWKRACAAYAGGSVDIAENLFKANLD